MCPQTTFDAVEISSDIPKSWLMVQLTALVTTDFRTYKLHFIGLFAITAFRIPISILGLANELMLTGRYQLEIH